MQRNIPLPAAREQFSERLQRAGLVISPHTGDERRSLCQQGVEPRKCYDTVPGDREQRRVEKSGLFAVAQGLEHRVVLNRRADEKGRFAARARRFRHRKQCPVIRLRAAGGEVKLFRQAAEGLRNLPSRPADRLPCSPAALIERRRVSALRRQVREHGFECRRAERHSRRMIQINHGLSPSSRR